jgi:hypothetical protein
MKDFWLSMYLPPFVNYYSMNNILKNTFSNLSNLNTGGKKEFSSQKRLYVLYVHESPFLSANIFGVNKHHNVKVIDVKRFIHISSFFNKLQKIFSTNPIVRREMILKYYS